MSNPTREQHPLLGDDVSEDEYLRDYPGYQRQYSNRNRTKYYVRGAASVLKQWPDHVSSLLTYWWMGLAMIGFTVFILYNSVLSIAVIPSPKVNKIHSNIKTNELFEHEAYKTVNMHIIVDDVGFDLSHYMPYIETISQQHPTFKFNFMILINDTDYTNNILRVVDKEIVSKTTQISLQTVMNVNRKSLSEFLNESPIRKYWRHLPQQYFGFLIRCISIWNKGGISINPQLFTLESPHIHFLENVQDVFRTFEKIYNKEGRKKSFKSLTKTKGVNNIRDIIDALENDSLEMNEQSNDINVAEENKEVLIFNRNSSDWMKSNVSLNKNESTVTTVINKSKPHIVDNKYPIKDNFIHDSSNDDKNLFPMFLKFLYPTQRNNTHKMQDINTNALSDTYEKNLQKSTMKNKKYIINENTSLKGRNKPNDYDLNIDLKGNIVATKTSCHAFLGSVFNTVIHHIKDETVTDLIISELSTFCKGNWMYCKGVNVLL